MGNIFVGDSGTEIVLDCGVDISSASVRSIIVKKPNGKRVQWPASLDGSSSVKYVTQPDDIDVAGDWDMQVYVEMSGWRGRGGVVTLRVLNAI